MFKIFTDSSANLTTDLIENLDLNVISLSFNCDDKEQLAYEKGKEFDSKGFYESLRIGKIIKTSLINTQAYIKSFEPILKEGQDVLYIGMSSGVSSSMNAARIAKEELAQKYPERNIAIIDTLAASLGEGIQVIKAAKLKLEGLSIDTITQKITNNLKSINQFFVVDDLKFLKRSGRVSATSAIVGSLLNIKPILFGDSEGKINLYSKVRGKRKTIEQLALKYEQRCTDLEDFVGIAHGDCDEDANYLSSLLKEKGCKGEIINVCYEPVTGAHVGPGTVALFFSGQDRDSLV